MKIFVLTKKNIAFYLVMILAALTLFITRWDSSVYVFNENSELNSLPIYSVDKGEEKYAQYLLMQLGATRIPRN